MLETYRAALRAPGASAFSAACLLMRLAMSMYPIGLVLLVSLRTGHYTFAGVLSGVYVVANGIGNPVLARLVDRVGQRRVLLPATAVHAAAVVVIIVLVEVGAPDWTLVAPTVVAGFCYLAVMSLVRARWSFVLAGRPELATAYSLESTLDEFVFTAGPLLATLLATLIDPVAVFVVGAAFVVAGAAWLRSLRASEPPLHPAGAQRRASALHGRGMVLLTFVAAAMGAVFAGAEITMIAFCGQHGQTGWSGAVIACLAAGSGVAGFVYGSRHHGGHILGRLRRQALIFTPLPLLFLAATHVAVLAALAFVVGLGVAPILINAFALVEDLVAPGALTEGMAWLTTGIAVGYGVSASLVGGIADAHGARPAFTVTIGAGLAVGGLVLLLRRRVAATEPAAAPVAGLDHAAVSGRGGRAPGAQAR